jgi:hypothetical protein
VKYDFWNPKMSTDWSKSNIEMLHSLFQGGEGDGRYLEGQDVANILADALKTILYEKIYPKTIPNKVDRSYFDNESFWRDALSSRHFPSAYIVLDSFHLMEWLPFSPGRYFTGRAKESRYFAADKISRDRYEYLPGGKTSMVRGGIGAIRLAEKTIRGNTIHFLGASSTGIAHQGIPIALPSEEYHKVMPIIKERGGCKVKLVGSLQTMTENFPALDFDEDIARYCLFAEEVTVEGASIQNELLTTAAIMFAVSESKGYYGDADKSWTFCSFHPGSSKNNERSHAVEWLLDYAKRYSRNDPTILTDFDEHYSFPCRVEFPISDILRGTVDWETLRVYKQRYGGTYIENIETYIKEFKRMEGDQITVHGSGNIIVSRSTVQNAFNKVKAEYGEETANALKCVEEEINKSGNKEAAENFESFSEELSKPDPKKSLLKTLWKGTLDALPSLAQLTSVVSSIVKLFG